MTLMSLICGKCGGEQFDCARIGCRGPLLAARCVVCWRADCKDSEHAVVNAKADALTAAMDEAALFRWLADLQCCELIVSRNGDHACNYRTASEWIDEHAEDFDGEDAAELARMKEMDTIWRVQVYPETPVGFYATHGATLAYAINAMRETLAADYPNGWKVSKPSRPPGS